MSEETSLTEESVVEDVAPDQETDPVATLTSDLQRLQAEYANYRKRVERDRSLAHEMAIGAVLTELLALLDDVDRAESHGELTGGFKAVADQLNTIEDKHPLEFSRVMHLNQGRQPQALGNLEQVTEILIRKDRRNQ